MPAPLPLPPEALDRLMPMHVLISPGGRIQRAGPTLGKILHGKALAGRSFFDLFELRRTRDGIEEDLSALLAAKVHLRLRDPARTQLIGTAVRLADGGGLLLNLSFGISVVDAVRRFNLAGSDFAATDLTVEMLYLVEAKSAAMNESRQLNERLNGQKAAAEAEAQSDTLTGLRNRRALGLVLDRLATRGAPFTLMHLDLDYFKTVNDTLGHAAGDQVLREVARILMQSTRQDDVVARIGGDEFVLVFGGLTNHETLATIADRMIARLEAPIHCPEGVARISASIGMVSSTQYDRPEVEQMMRDADIALYASKRQGRSRHNFYAPEMGQELPPDAVEEAQAPVAR